VATFSEVQYRMFGKDCWHLTYPDIYIIGNFQLTKHISKYIFYHYHENIHNIRYFLVPFVERRINRFWWIRRGSR